VGGLRFEAWTLPWAATFQRVIADIPAITGTGKGSVRLSDFGSGRLSVSSDYDRLDEIVSTTVGSLIRVYDGTTIVHEWMAERVDHTLADDGVATIQGNDIASAFDRAIVYPYDYTTNPTTFPNHVWGGPNNLDNEGFELQENVAQIVEVDVGAASGGTWFADISGDPTAAIAWNASDTTVQNAIETGITEITDVLVTGTGQTSDPWRIEFVTPPVPTATMTGDGTLLTPSDTLTVSTVQIGNAEVSQSWTQSQRADSRSTPALHGTYTIFRQSSGAEPVNTGSFSQVVSGTQYAGVQQIIQVEPGATFQAAGYVNSNTASQTFRLVIRDRYENYIASVEITPTINTWTQATITDVIIPAGVDEVVVRFANITPSAAGIWYFDDMEFNQGLAAGNLGVIMTALMDDAITDHAADTRGAILDWVQITSWDATNDSSTTAWQATESFTAFRGATYGNTFDRIRDMNYEWRLVPITPAAPITHDLEWYNVGNLGTDYTTSAFPAILPGQGITAGKIIQRIPRSTAVLVEGEGGIYIEDKDSTAETNFGRLELYKGDVGLNSTTSISATADKLVDLEAQVRTTIQLTLVSEGEWPRPLVDYTVGDELNTTLPPIISKTGKRVSMITYQNTEPPTYQVTLIEPPTVFIPT